MITLRPAACSASPPGSPRRSVDLDRWAWTTSSLVISRAMGGDPVDDTESLALRACLIICVRGCR